MKDIEEIDGERIENKHDPLAGFYHYNAHMAILFWDLIEESPVFTDEERLKVTNAFARQLNHRKDEGVYRLTQPPSDGQLAARAMVGDFAVLPGPVLQQVLPQPVVGAVREGRASWPSSLCTNTPGFPARATTCSGTARASPRCSPTWC